MSTAIPWTPVKVGWMSGVSRVGSNALSGVQSEFVAGLPVPGAWKQSTNFPYGESLGDYQHTPLVWASLVNAARFVAASTPVRRRHQLERWRALKASCDRLFLVTSSCGSQIAASFERAAPDGAQLAVFALGPVDWGCAGLDIERVVGRGDWLSRMRGGHGSRRTQIDGVGHMDYARSSEARALAASWLNRRLEVDSFAAPDRDSA